MYLQATTTAVWAPQGQTPVVRVHPGREMVHFYGTLNLNTGQEIAMPSTKMNAEATVQHLEQILEAIPQGPVLLLWDRGPWHRGPRIQEVLEANPRLEVMFFPVAAPDLNPQEHVWKATRQAVSHNHTLTRLADLANQFEGHLSATTFESSFLDTYGFNEVCSRFK